MKLVLVVLAFFCTAVLSEPDPVCVTNGITDDATLVPCKEGFEANEGQAFCSLSCFSAFEALYDTCGFVPNPIRSSCTDPGTEDPNATPPNILTPSQDSIQCIETQVEATPSVASCHNATGANGGEGSSDRLCDLACLDQYFQIIRDCGVDDSANLVTIICPNSGAMGTSAGMSMMVVIGIAVTLVSLV